MWIDVVVNEGFIMVVLIDFLRIGCVIGERFLFFVNWMIMINIVIKVNVICVVVFWYVD